MRGSRFMVQGSRFKVHGSRAQRLRVAMKKRISNIE
jgi:hypothetical protein